MTDLSALEAEVTSSLLDVTTQLDEHYKQWKKSEGAKDKAKKEFFKLINERLEHQTLAEQVVTIRALDELEARKLIEQTYPKWQLKAIRPAEETDDGWEAILIENPAYKPDSYFNPQTQMVYSRQISSGAILLDNERLQDREPDLWRLVTTIPNARVIEFVMYECGEDLPAKLGRLWDLFDGPRELIPFEELAPELLARLGEYIYEGKPTAKLAAPKKAEEEDLASSSEV